MYLKMIKTGLKL